MKSCFFGYGGTGYTQNFLSRDYLGLFFPKSVMEGTFNLGVPVTNAVWKAYGRKCFGAGGGAVTHILLARPLWIEQGTGPTTTRQDFQYGFITRDNADPNAVIVNVYLYQPIPLAPILLCTFPNLVDYHIGQCWDSNRDGSVDIADWLEELNHYGDETSGVYDDVYDHNRNGFVGEADVQAVADHFGQVCK